MGRRIKSFSVCTYMVKTFKNLFSRTKKASRIGLCISCLGVTDNLNEIKYQALFFIVLGMRGHRQLELNKMPGPFFLKKKKIRKLSLTCRLLILSSASRKHAYIILTPPPLKPHFYIVKLGFTCVYIIFLISVQKHRLWVLIRIALVRQC